MSNIIDFNRERIAKKTSQAQSKTIRCACGKNGYFAYVPAGSMDASKAAYQCVVCNAVKVIDAW
jgi:hypothetical protein